MHSINLIINSGLQIIVFHILQVVKKVWKRYSDEDVKKHTQCRNFPYPVFFACDGWKHDIATYTIRQFISKWHIMFKLFLNYNYQSWENNVIRIWYRVSNSALSYCWWYKLECIRDLSNLSNIIKIRLS